MRILKSIIMLLALLFASATTATAQNITSVHGTVSDDMGPLMGATVCEIDGTGRIIESAITDLNGNFTMKVRNPKDKIRFSYVGQKTVTLPINKTTFNVTMSSATQIKEVVVKSKKRLQGNSLPIPEREISYSTQTINMKEFEGLGITSVDEALQGRIAGLDIIGNSGDLGSGSTMRLRGASTLSAGIDSNPLIVVDGNIREVDLSNTDLNSLNDEKFSELLNLNPEDIASITVLKDAAATAIYGSQGGNGVIELTTKRGVRGKPKVTYSLKLTGTYQPKGYKLLSGDDYTMMLKEAYFNPSQNDGASANIEEINYSPDFSELEQYNNNTDWIDAVTQWGLRQNHYVNISGGGEKASFRIGGGFDHETGTIIKQKLNRFSTRVALDYNVSQRIRVSTNFALTYTKNDRNYHGLLGIAQRKMPNMSIYQQDPLTGEDTDTYYNMLQTASTVFDKDQKTMDYVNPVASANLAKNQQRTYDVSPELVINYQLWGTDEDHWQLNWRGSVYMNIFNKYEDQFLPQELTTTHYTNENVNRSYSGASKSVSFNTKQTLTLIPAFRNKDHSAMLMGRFELTSGSSTNQGDTGYNLASGGIMSPEAGGKIKSFGSGFGEWRSMYYTVSGHYAYKGRYMLDATLRADGTTKFGPDNRWGFFPSVSLRWNIIDEPWFRRLAGLPQAGEDGGWLSMFSLRPSWGRVGNQPGGNYLYASKYGTAPTYLDMNGMFPINIRLNNLKWQINSSYNLGIDLGFFNDRLTMVIEGYHSTVTNMLMNKYRIPSNSGFSDIAVRNTGKMRNIGWEFHINTNQLVKAGKFIMDMNVNFGNNKNELLEMEQYLLDQLGTSTFDYKNASILRRVQVHNPLGAIYGFRYKGVYDVNYSTFANLSREEQRGLLDGTLPQAFYDKHDWEKRPMTAPVALNEKGEIVYDGTGAPMRMMYNYTNDATGRNYRFQGGDAIYEDINNDGQINALDIVYLGSSLPKLTGGFGFTFTYGDWRLNTQFTYRYGNKIINLKRLQLEAMNGNDNQSQAVNYRWRKEGDDTTIPRAMFGAEASFNSLVSDRFVEDGSYLRMGYAQLTYTIKKKHLKWIGLNRINLYASVNNPFVITKYSGVDPDISQAGYSPAIDNSQTPRPRSYTMGVTVDF